jgi:hypothetical protein
LIVPSSSNKSSGLLFVNKPDGSLRMCVDYCKTNMMLMKDVYSLPRRDTIIDLLAQKEWFLLVVLCDLYNHLQLNWESENLTIFVCMYWCFLYKDMLLFCLSLAPAYFQRFKNSVLREFLGGCVIVYLNDILIFSFVLKDPMAFVKRVLWVREKPVICGLNKM